jgi:hypothetical protein
MNEAQKHSIDQHPSDRLSDAKKHLEELLNEDHPEIIMDSSIISSGTLLANQYAFEISALEAGKDPDTYRKLGAVGKRDLGKVFFGSHSDDIFSPVYAYDINNKLTIQKEEYLWRLKDQRDYIKVQE